MKKSAIVGLAMALVFSAPMARGSWEASQRITWTPDGSGNPAIAIDAYSDIHVVWHDFSPGAAEIFYKKSSDGGASWLPSQRLTWTDGQSLHAAIAVDLSSNIHVVWQDATPGKTDIYYRKSANGGASWQPIERLTWTTGASNNPAIAVDPSGNIHVVWEDDSPGNYEIYTKTSTNGGSTWSVSQRLTWTTGASNNPDIAVDFAGHIRLAWEDGTPGNWEIYYKESEDGGTTWSASQRLTWTLDGSFAPDVDIDTSGFIHVVWHDFTIGYSEIFYKKSLDGGSTWTTGKRLTWTPNFSYDPALVCDPAGVLHVVWEYYTPGSDELYYKKSTDGGANWTSSQRLTWTTGDSWFPDAAIDGYGFLHIVWSDNTPYAGNYEIYYKKGN